MLHKFPLHQLNALLSHYLLPSPMLKVDADDSSNEWWRSDQEDELIRLISTPIVDAISKIDSQQNNFFD